MNLPSSYCPIDRARGLQKRTPSRVVLLGRTDTNAYGNTDYPPSLGITDAKVRPDEMQMRRSHSESLFFIHSSISKGLKKTTESLAARERRGGGGGGGGEGNVARTYTAMQKYRKSEEVE